MRESIKCEKRKITAVLKPNYTSDPKQQRFFHKTKADSHLYYKIK